MRKNQVTIQVMQIRDDSPTPIEYTVYCDSNDFYEALAGAFGQVIEETQKRDKLPNFGDKSVTYKQTTPEMKVVDGDLFDAEADVIVHQVNCQGRMGSGVAKQVREKYPKVYTEYQAACSRFENKADLLGQVLYVKIPDGRTVANMFAQLNYGYDGKLYTNYAALDSCLRSINKKFAGKKVALPYKIGCDRGGADWGRVSNMINKRLSQCDVTLYRLTK